MAHLVDTLRIRCDGSGAAIARFDYRDAALKEVQFRSCAEALRALAREVGAGDASGRLELTRLFDVVGVDLGAMRVTAAGKSQWYATAAATLDAAASAVDSSLWYSARPSTCAELRVWRG